MKLINEKWSYINLILILLFFGIISYSCSKISPVIDIENPSSESSQTVTTPPAGIVIAKTSIQISTKSQVSTASTNHTSLAIQSSDVSFNIGIDPQTIFTLTATPSLTTITESQLQSQDWVTLNGSINFDIFYNDLVGVTAVNLRAYILNAQGLVGESNSNITIPVKIYRVTGNINTQLTNTAQNLTTWTNLNTAINESNFQYQLLIQPYQAIAQNYSANLIFELTKIE